MTDTPLNITVIGLGKIGAAMSKRLLQAGANLTVYNRTIQKAQPLIAAGARGATSFSS